MERANGIPLQNAHVQACGLNDRRTDGGNLNRHLQTDVKTQVSRQKMNKDRLCCWPVLETVQLHVFARRNVISPRFTQAEALCEMPFFKLCF